MSVGMNGEEKSVLVEMLRAQLFLLSDSTQTLRALENRADWCWQYVQQMEGKGFDGYDMFFDALIKALKMYWLRGKTVEENVLLPIAEKFGLDRRDFIEELYTGTYPIDEILQGSTDALEEEEATKPKEMPIPMSAFWDWLFEPQDTSKGDKDE